MREDQQLRNIPIIVISAQPDMLEIDRLKRQGVAGYLSKPFTAEAVRDLVVPLLDARSHEKEEPAEQQKGSFNVTLIEALGEALETMAFISPQLPGETKGSLSLEELRLVKVDFTGHGIHGSLAIAAPAAFGTLIASSCSEQVTPAQSDDALKELANVTCGLLLRRRIGGGTGFKLEPPVMAGKSEADHLITEDDAVAVDADGYRISAHVTSDACLFSGASN
jgi:hypothetical protein